ncbi:hypothetical protein [Brevundimonas diminuta]|uniref:hypothetical protein n=1 Tax=Brevundimonas diminuta TaxID=293 RepID=UPI00320AEE02
MKNLDNGMITFIRIDENGDAVDANGWGVSFSINEEGNTVESRWVKLTDMNQSDQQ